jgi:ribonucleases P/MRP protein subunit RPP40
VPHSVLLHKLHNVGIESQLVKWVGAFLSNRCQKVSVSGILSNPVKVLSGVPQGSVLGPLLFLIFINDLPEGVSSSLRLFADDCIIYQEIHSINDVAILQQSLGLLSQWCIDNGMAFNVKKCQCITFTLKHAPIVGLYMLASEVLTRVTECKYLGLTFSSDLTWSAHTRIISGKAMRALFAIQRSFRKCSIKTKESLYFSLVRSLLEYACIVWDPFGAELTLSLEKVQRRAARFVLNRFGRVDSVSTMIETLGWHPLELRRKICRLVAFHHAYSGAGGWVDLHANIIPARFVGRGHQHQVFLPFIRTNACLQSFLPRTSREWNALPIEYLVDDLPTISSFRGLLLRHFNGGL